MQLLQETVDTDVLIVGGGLAGCMAAIKATESGVRATIVEKANTLRSGAAATGVDHIRHYDPEVHAVMGSVEEVAREINRHSNPFGDEDVYYQCLMASHERVKDLERFGVPVKLNGRYDYISRSGTAAVTLHFSGRDIKVCLSQEARKRGVEIVNRTMVTDLLTQGDQVTGAIALSTREPKAIVFRAKALILTTGGSWGAGLWPGPSEMMFDNFSIETPDGLAMAWRARAEIANAELSMRWAGPRSFCRAGKGTWIGVGKNSKDEFIGGVPISPSRHSTDPAIERADSYIRMYELGEPVYMDCRHISNEDYEYMKYYLENEGNSALLNHLDEEGIDPRRHRIEFTFYAPFTRAGVDTNERAMASLEALYAAGDVTTSLNGLRASGAMYIGWLAGRNAAEYAKQARFSTIDSHIPFIEEKRKLYREILSRETGANWQELQWAIHDIMGHYVSPKYLSDALLNVGLTRLRNLREKALPTLKAENAHELMRCLESLNMVDVAEVVVLSCLERKETRPEASYSRIDYPKTDDRMDKILLVRQEGGKPVFRWRERRKIR